MPLNTDQRVAVLGSQSPSPRIMYVFVVNEETKEKRSPFHLLHQPELDLLRCFMALLLLPATADAVAPTSHPYIAALQRVADPPSFRKLPGYRPLNAQELSLIDSESLLVLMVVDESPVWLQSLLDRRPVALLSPWPKTIDRLRHFNNLHVGLLRGMEDVRQSYAALGRLISTVEAFSGAPQCILPKHLKDVDLFAERPRLDYLPPIPLPGPADGRAAVYLLNRLSNNVDEPGIAPSRQEKAAGAYPQLLHWGKLACSALATIEMGTELPNRGVSATYVGGVYSTLTTPLASADEKRMSFMDLGRRLSYERWISRPFISIPVPRFDLFEGNAPDSLPTMGLDPDIRRTARQAAEDLIFRRSRSAFGTARKKKAYEQSRETLIREQRLLACQTAILGGIAHCEPIQLPMLPTRLFGILGDFNASLSSGSGKTADLFRQSEAILGELLPELVRDNLALEGHPAVFLSDLPFEWAMVNQWPVCLTRPVSRIPLTLNHWDTLAAAAHRTLEIDTARPERVLVFDCIAADDPVRQHSESFANVSDSLRQKYTYRSPRTADDFKRALREVSPDIVVLDAHGIYDARRDSLAIDLNGRAVSVDALLPDSIVPPTWLLSSCSTSVTGARRGCLVRTLLSRGAVSVVGTLGPVDAFLASMFIGRLLTNIYNPVATGQFKTFGDLFFTTQFTTALLYDPLLPLIHKSKTNDELKRRLGGVLGGYFHWADSGELSAEEYRHEAAYRLGALMDQNGLRKQYDDLWQAGLIRPETLLFTAFGLPHLIHLATPLREL